LKGAGKTTEPLYQGNRKEKSISPLNKGLL
jgi:hypothetical protein